MCIKRMGCVFWEDGVCILRGWDVFSERMGCIF